MRKIPKFVTFSKKRSSILQYVSFQNSLNITFSIRLKRGWSLVLEESFKKNENTEIEIEAKNRAKCYDFKPLTMRYSAIHKVFVKTLPTLAI